MKKKILSILMISALILSGCSAKGTLLKGTDSSDTTGNPPTATSVQASKDSGSSAAAAERVEVKTDFKQVKPGTVPELSQNQKTQVNTQLKSTVNDLSKIMKSIQDAQDVDLNSVN